MKSRKLLLSLMAMFLSTLLFSQAPNFEVRIENEKLVSSTEYQFDIRLYATGSTTSWEMAGFTVGVGFNSTWRNGATIASTASTLFMSGTSDMNTSPNQVPTSGSIQTTAPNCIKIASTSAPGAGSGTQITQAGKRLIRVKLLATSGSFSTTASPDLYFLFSSYPSSLSAYLGSTNTVIAGSGTTTTNGVKPSDGAQFLKSNTYWNGSTWNRVNWSSGTTYASTTTAPSSSSDDAVIYASSATNTGAFTSRRLYVTSQATLNAGTGNAVSVSSTITNDGTINTDNFAPTGSGQTLNSTGSVTFGTLNVSGNGTTTFNLTGSNNINTLLAVNGTTTLNVASGTLTVNCGATSNIAAGASATGVTYNNIATTISSQPSSLTQSSGSNATFSVSATGGGTLTYQWNKNGSAISGATSSSYTINGISSGDAGSYTCTVTGNCGSVTSNAATLTVSVSLSITSQPSDVTVCNGGNASFSVTASGSNLTYQWNKGGSAISGATSSTYSITGVSSSNAGSYTCTVSSGGSNVTSNAATLTVNNSTTITTQPSSVQQNAGSNATFSVSASGTGTLTYQWHKNGSAISGATSSSYTINNISSSDAGSYSCDVTGSCGTVSSNAATLALNTLSITSQPSNSTICPGFNASFSVSASGSGTITYQWQKNGVDIPGATSATYSISVAIPSDAGSYSCNVTNVTGTQSSSSATLTINASTAITSQPSDVNVNSGANASFSVSASGAGTLTYQWYKNGSAISGATSSSYSITGATSSDAGIYACDVNGSCGLVGSNPATLTVNTLSITSNPSNVSACLGANASFSVSASGSGTISYQWNLNGSPISGATSSTYSISSVSSGDAGSYTCDVTNVTGTQTSSAGVLSINAATAITSQPSNVLQNSGTNASFSVSATGAGTLNYQWYFNGSAISGATSSTLSLTNISSSNVGSYTCDVTGTCGTVSSSSASLGLTSLNITSQPSAVSVCSGDNASFSVSATGTGTLTYQWYKGANAISGATSSSYSITGVTSSDAGNYSCEISGSAGTVMSNTAALSLKAATSVSTQPSSQLANLGDNVQFVVSALGSGTLTYQWSYNGTPISGATSSTLTLVNISNSDIGSYACTVTGDCGSATSSSASLGLYYLNITSNPSNVHQCNGTNATFSVSASGNGTISYQWMKNGSTISGATSSTLTLNAISSSDAGSYSCDVTNESGTHSSSAATLSVGASTSITSQPSSLQQSAGSTATFSVSASGDGTLTYQWKKNGTNISGATSSTLTLSNISSSDAASYSVVVTGNCGSATSSSASLVLNTLSITTQPSDYNGCTGTTATFTVSASGNSTISYQWKHNGTAISGATSASYSTTANSTNAGTYSCDVTNAAGTVSSNSATLSLKAATSITTQPSSVTPNLGSSTSFTVVGAGAGTLSYQWFKNGTSISGATSSTYSIATVGSSDNGSYTVTVTGDCGSVTSSAATLSPQGLNFEVRIENEQRVSNTEYQFDIMLYAKGSTTSWEMSGFTAGIAYNPTWINGATLNNTSSIILMPGTSDMNTSPNQVPVSATFNTSANRIQIASTSAPGAGNGTIITQSGKRLIRVKILASSGSFSTTATPNLYFLFSGYSTSLSAYFNGANTVIAGSSTNLTNGLIPADGTPNMIGGVYWNGLLWNRTTWASGSIYNSSSAAPGSNDDAIIYSSSTTNTGSFSARKLYVSGLATLNAGSGNTASVNNNLRNDGTINGNIALNGSNQTWNGSGNLACTNFTANGGGTKTLNLVGNNTLSGVLTVSGTSTFAVASGTLNLTCNATTSIESGSSATGYTLQNSGTTFTTQPTDATASLGDNVYFTASASGLGTITYQWYKNGSAISGATNASLTINGVVAGDAGSYTCVATGTCGSVTSSAAVLTINAFLSISTQPSNTSVCSGATASFNVVANSNNTVSYQWKKNGTAISGATSSTLSISNVSSADAGTYSVDLTNAAGTVTSNNATLSLKAATAITTNPSSVTVGTGANTIFTVAATGAGTLTYQWQKNGTNITNATNSTLTITSANSNDAGSYACIVTGDCGSATSSSATLTINNSYVGFEVRIENEKKVSNTEYQFDVMMYATGGTTSWELAGFTAGIGVNPTWRNGATISTTSSTLLMAGTSDMNTSPNQVPTSATFSTATPNRIQIASTSAPGAGSGTNIPTTGKRLIRVKLVATSGSFSSTASPDLYFLLSGYASSVSAYINGINTVIAGNSTTTANGVKPSDGAVNLKGSVYWNGSTWNRNTWSSGTTYASSNAAPTSSDDAVIYSTSATTTGAFNARKLYVTGASYLDAGSTNAVNVYSTLTNEGVIGTYSLGLSGSSQTVNSTGTINVSRLIATNGGTKTINGAGTNSVTGYVSSTGSTTLNVASGTFNVQCPAYITTDGTSSATGFNVISTNNPTISANPSNTSVNVGTSATLSVTASSPASLSYQWKKNGTDISGATSSSYTIASTTNSDDADYSVVVSSSCGSVTSSSAHLTINYLNINTNPSNVSSCVGTNVSFSVSASGNGTLSYQWKKGGVAISGATSSTLSINNISATDAANYTVDVTNAWGTKTSGAAILAVKALAAITTQPSNQVVVLGSTTSFSVSASGEAPLSYQWSKNGVAISGATSSTYTINSVSSGDVGSYTVSVSNSCNSVTSNTATLDNYFVTIATQPSSQAACPGTNVTFNVSASTNGSLAYQWKKNNVNISGATSSSLTLNNVSTSDAANYTVVVSSQAGSVVSSIASLTLKTPTSITSNPSNATKFASQSIALSAGGSGYGTVTYQWFKNGTAVSNGANISGATSTQLIISGVTGSDAGNYTLAVTGACGTLSTTASAVSVITAQPSSIPSNNTTFCAGNTASFSTSVASPGFVTYQWTKGGVAISGANSSTYSINSTTTADAGSYACAVTAGGITLVAGPASLAITPLTAITTQPSGSTVSAGATVSLSVVATAATSYQWKKNGSNITGATAASYSFVATAGDDADYSCVVTGACNSVTSSTAHITINYLSITSQPSSASQCAGTNVSFSVTASGNGTIAYQWKKGGVAISGATSSSYTINNIAAGDAGTYTVDVSNANGTVTSAAATLVVKTLTSITSQPVSAMKFASQSALFTVSGLGYNGIAYQWYKNGSAISGATTSQLALSNLAGSDAGSYSVILSSGCGNVTSSTANLAVVTAQPGSFTNCAGASHDFTVSASSGSTLSYQWKRNGISIAGATSSTYSITNSTTSDAGSISCVISADGLSLEAGPATYVVNALTAITTQPSSSTVSAGTSVTLTVTASNATSYQWKKNGSAITGATGASYSFNAIANDDADYTVVVNGLCNSVTSSAAHITINYLSITSQPVSISQCAGTNATFSVSASGNGTLSYQWKKGGVAISGANSSSFTINSISAGDAASYTVDVTNALGTITSAAATLTVKTLTAITTQPLSAIKLAGQSQLLTVAGQGWNGIAYQWSKNGTAITGATTSELLLSNVSSSDAATYTVTLTSACGNVTSTDAVLTVVSAQPSAVTQCAGNNASFSISAASGATISYQWKRNGTAISGAISSTYSVTGSTSADAGSISVLISAGSLSQEFGPVSYIVNTNTAITTQPSNTTVANGSNASLSVSAVGTALTYQWYKNGSAISGATASTLSLTAVTSAADADYTVTVSGTCGSVTSNTAHLTVNYLTITSQPSSLTKCPGESASFSVSASGNGSLSYQWKKGGVAISGATSSSYSINSVASGDAGTYTVDITNASGTVSSAAAILTVNAPTVITTQPIGTTRLPGQSALLSVSATGQGGASYQWYKNGSAISGATTSQLLFSSLLGSDGGDYTVGVTYGCGTATSSIASINVVTSQPTGSSVCIGSSTSMSVGVSGGSSAITYQWKKNNVNISGATSSTYTINSASLSDAASYTVVVSGSGASVTTSPVVISTKALTVVGTNPVSALKYPSQSVAFTASGTGNGTLSYQWNKDGSPLSNGTNVSGATTAQLVITGITSTDAANYSLSITGGCGTATSNAASLVVVTTQPQAVTKCAGQDASFSVAAVSGSSISYQWQLNGSNISGATSTSLSLTGVTSADAGNYQVVLTSGGSSWTIGPVALTVNATTAITSQPSSQTVSAGSNASFSVSANGTNLTYQWRKNGTAISGATSSTLSLTSVTTANDADYSVVVNGTCGSATSSTAHLTVNYLSITSQPVSVTQCSGTNASFSVTATGNGTLSYQWKKNGTAISGATSSSYSINGIASGDAASYTVDVTNAFGTITSNAATLSISSVTSITTQPVSVFKAAGQSALLTVAATGSGSVSYQWKKGGSNISGATTSQYLVSSVTSADAGDYTVTVQYGCGSATSSVASITVFNTQPTSVDQCAGTNASFSVGIATGSDAVTYQWKKAGVAISGATSATLSLTNISSADQANYTCDVTAASTTITSSVASLLVRTSSTITTQPISAIKYSTQSASFYANGTGYGTVSYQWMKNGSVLSNGTNVSGATTSTLSVTNISSADVANYSLALTSSCGTATSNNAAIALVTAQPTSITQCSGGTATFAVGVSSPAGSSLSYQWLKGGVNVSGATSASYSINPTAGSDAGIYTCNVSVNGTTLSVGPATLTINLPPTITVQPSNQAGISNGSATFTATATGTGLAYRWFQIKNGTLFNPVAATGTYTSSMTISPLSTSYNGYTFVVKVTGTCSSTGVVSNSALLTVTLNKNASGIAEVYGNPDVSVYPVPVVDDVTILTKNFAKDNYTVELFDQAGKSVITRTTTSDELNNGFKMNMSDYSNGVYFIHILNSHNELQSVSKIVR